MSEKKVAILNIWKALAGIPLAALAAWGSATGNPGLAALLAVPSAGLAAFDTLGNQFTKLRPEERDEDLLELPIPLWWKDSIPAWEGLCAEIGDHLPDILRNMDKRMQRTQGVLTRQVVRQTLINALADEPLIWAPIADERRKIGESIVAPLLGKMYEVLEELKPLIEQKQRETLLLDIHEIAGNTEKVVNVLEGMHIVGKPSMLSDKEIAFLCQQYCQTLYERWKMLDFKGIMHVEMNRPMGIPLMEVFVSPDLLVGFPEYETLEREDVIEDYGGTENLEQDWQDGQEPFIEQMYSQRGRKQFTLQREDLPGVLSKHRRLVILGDPGAGKSTLLRYLMLLLVQGIGKFAADFPQLAYASSTLPLYMTLSSYAEFWRSSVSGERSLKHFIPRYLNDNYLEAYADFLQEQLEHGKVFLLFDGLDEIPDVSLRTQIVRQIEAFTLSYPDNHFIVTSRIVGYKGAQLAADYQPHTLADFNEQQIKAFTQKWCPAYERWVGGTTEGEYLKDAATREAEKLFSATQRNPGVKRLAVNPLLLTILALIQRQGIELPSHRIELFELCATTLLETWVRAKGQSMQLSKNELVKILRPLAFWMHNHPEVGAIPEEELIKHVVKKLRERQITEDEALRRAEQFLHTVRDELGILVERGKHRYGFLHLTFEEYFAACELEQNENRNSFIRKNLHNSRWREVILLTVGIVGIIHSNEKSVTKLIQEAILKAKSPFEKWLHRDLLFAGFCLADDVGASISCEDDIIERIINLYLFNPFDWLRNALSSVLTSWSGTNVATKAASLILMILKLSQQQEIALGKASQNPLTPPSSFNLLSLDAELKEYYQGLIQQYPEPQLKLLRLRSIFILCHLRFDVTAWIEFALVMLADADFNIRRAAVKVLGQVGKGQLRVIDALLQHLSSSEYNDRWAVTKALGQLADDQPRVSDALLHLLIRPDSDNNLRRTAAEALRRVESGHQGVINTLLQLLSDPDYYLKRVATEALGQLGYGQPDVINALLPLLSSPDHELDHSKVRHSVVRALGQLRYGQPDVINALLPLLSSPDHGLRWRTAEALGQLGYGQPDVINALLPLLSSSKDVVKVTAAEALGQVGGEYSQVIDTLLPFLSSPDHTLRLKVARSLGQLVGGQPQVVDALYRLCFDPVAEVREAAVKAFGQVGSGHPQVISALLHLLSDPDWQVRQSSARTLTNLPIDRLAVSLHIEELLQQNEPIDSSQLEVDDNTDALLFALFQTVGEYK